MLLLVCGLTIINTYDAVASGRGMSAVPLRLFLIREIHEIRRQNLHGSSGSMREGFREFFSLRTKTEGVSQKQSFRTEPIAGVLLLLERRP